MEPKPFEIAILASGDFPSHDRPLRALREADEVVCCDSSYAEYVRRGLDDGRCTVVGDGDSLPASLRHALGSRFVLVTEQDYNDLHKAMVHAMTLWGDRRPHVSIVGATGRREDHTLGNISYSAEFAEMYPSASVDILTDYGVFTSFRGQRTYRAFPGQQVSLFGYDPTLAVSGTGLRYPLDGLRMRRWWCGTLNEALADSFMLRSEGWITVFQTYDPKRPSV